MKKTIFMVLLLGALTASANNMSQERALKGFEVKTKAYPKTETLAQAESLPEADAPAEPKTAPKQPTLNPRAHPKHRAGLHK